MSPESAAKFDVGQVVHHRMFHYRGVIFDVDPVFSGTEEWYEQVAKSRPPRDQPWYHVLPHGADSATHTTYVAERNLEAVEAGEAAQPINHPLVGELFERSEAGVYVPKATSH